MSKRRSPTGPTAASNRWRRAPAHPLCNEEDLGPSVPDLPPGISVSYEVEAGGTTYDAFSLAQQCMDDWQTYLTSKGLF